MKLPTYTNNKKTGNIAADTLKSVLQRFSIVDTIEESIDLGIDMRGQIVDNSIPKDMFYNIQSKGTNEIEISKSKEYYSVPIKVTTINYWTLQNETTFLFLVDISNSNCYWCNPLMQLEGRKDEIQNQETVNVRVPLKNCINAQSVKLPIEFINCISLYMVKSYAKLADITEKIEHKIKNRQPLNTSQSLEILETLIKEANRIKNNYYKIVDALLMNIKDYLENSKKIYLQLEHNPCVNQYCRKDIFYETGFSKQSSKSLSDLYNESYKLIELFEKDKDNIGILKEIEACEKESEYIYKNMLAFLYEMACEDNPYGDHTELEELVNRVVYNIK